MKKITLAVLFGGSSTEYEISLQSAHAVLTHLDRDRYEPVLLGITRDGRWLLYQGPVDALLDDTWHTDARHTVPAVISPDRGVHGLLLIAPAGPSTRYLDAAFPVLHGKNGEDGTVQGLLELAGIPVVGCGVLASALCMDKDVAHRLVQAAGVAVPPSILFRAGEGLDTLPERTASLTYPLFVKPARAGSSFGITKVEEPGVLAEAVAAALAHDSKVVIEEAVPGFEVGCAVLGNEVLTVGHVDEIELSGGFFNYTEKYGLITSSIHMPARISQEKETEIQATAQLIYRALECSGFARVDLFLTPDGRIVFNEVNTIPGFTAHSRYPNMMRSIGLEFGPLLDRLIGLAVAARKVRGTWSPAPIPCRRSPPRRTSPPSAPVKPRYVSTSEPK